MTFWLYAVFLCPSSRVFGSLCPIQWEHSVINSKRGSLKYNRSVITIFTLYCFSNIVWFVSITSRLDSLELLREGVQDLQGQAEGTGVPGMVDIALCIQMSLNILPLHLMCRSPTVHNRHSSTPCARCIHSRTSYVTCLAMN